MFFYKKLMNHKGYSLVGSLILTTVLAMMGATTLYMTSSALEGSTNDTQSVQALQVGNAGIQFALNSLSNGTSPDGVVKNFGAGYFEISADPTTYEIIVDSHVGKAKKTQKINATNWSEFCLNWDTETSTLQDNQITNLKLMKTCNNQATLTAMKLTWTAEENEEAKTNQENDTNKKNQFTICHRPPGHPENAHTITVGKIAKKMHMLLHKDTEGPCESQTVIDEENLTFDKATFVEEIIYDGSPSGAESGSLIDTDDKTLVGDGSYAFNSLEFSKNLPLTADYTITSYFADGSQKTGVFSFINGNLVSNNENGDNSSNPGFEVEADGNVTVDPYKNIEVKLLGSAITCGAYGPGINVGIDLGINNSYSTLWNNVGSSQNLIYNTNTEATNASFTIRARGALPQCNNFSVAYNSKDNSPTQVKVLTNGQQAPNIQGFGGQADVAQYLGNYLNEEGQVVLANNQVIYLYELGVNLSSNPYSSAADFQDAVVLLTITDHNE